MNHDYKLDFKHFQKLLQVNFCVLCVFVKKCLKHLDLIVCMQIATHWDFLQHNLFLCYS